MPAIFSSMGKVCSTVAAATRTNMLTPLRKIQTAGSTGHAPPAKTLSTTGPTTAPRHAPSVAAMATRPSPVIPRPVNIDPLRRPSTTTLTIACNALAAVNATESASGAPVNAFPANVAVASRARLVARHRASPQKVASQSTPTPAAGQTKANCEPSTRDARPNTTAATYANANAAVSSAECSELRRG